MLACWLGLALAASALWTSQAQAATGHQFLSSLSEAPPGTKLLEPAALAVDRFTGQVFVGDRLSGYVDAYGPSGEYQTHFGGGAVEAAGIALDESSGDVYVAEPLNNAVLVYEPDGKGGYELLSKWSGAATPGKAFGEVTGVAVDNSKGPSQGELYVVEVSGGEGGTVDVYEPKPNPAEGEAQEGEFIKRLSGPKLEAPNGIAVSASTGRVLVADSVKGAIFAYSPSGAFEEKLTGKGSPNGTFKGKGELGNVAAVAVDESTGEIYVAEAERHAVSQYSSAGTWEGWITNAQSADLGEPSGVALTAVGEVYVADARLAMVDHFGASVVVPDAETGKVAKSGLTRTSAVLAGTINGEGEPSKYRFQYGATQALGSETTTQDSGSGEEKVSSEVSGLHAGGTYYFRIIGENENGANYGLVHEFQTPPAVEALSTGPIKSLQPESATLTGKLTPGGFDAHYYFQWGTTVSYANSTPTPPGTDAGSGTSAVEAETGLSGVSPNTLYHYRIVAENSFGVTFGADKSFTTSGPPRITNEPTSGISQTEATIHARINPDQLASTYHFEYGQSTSYGTEVPSGGEAIGSGSTPVAVSAALSSLSVGTTYHYRVITENEAGTMTGPDQTFTTVPPAPMDATFATAVSASEATLHTLINPLGNDTHYYFQYGSQSCQANPAACTNSPLPPGEDIGAGSEDVARELKLTGLTPGTTYHFRVLDSNSLGETQGPERTFTTQQETGTFALPDNRAWEMVSPPDKGGAPVEALTREGGLIMVSEGGDALTYVVDGALGEEVQGNRSPEWQQVLATRIAGGWSSQDIATPSSNAKGLATGSAPEYQFFTPDLSVALVEPFGSQLAEPPLAPGVVQATMYLRDDATGTYLPLVTEADTAPGVKFGGQVQFQSATPDLSHVVISSGVELTGAGSSHGLYEWAGGQLRFVSVTPNGKAAVKAELGYAGRVLTHAVSGDGSRVVWTVPEGGVETTRGHLYMRDIARGQTVELDSAQGVAEPGKGSAQYQGASSDGARVFFTDKQRLTADSTAEPAEGTGRPDLYECMVVEAAGKLACDLKDLTVDSNTNEHATVQNLVFGIGEDGRSVYVLAQGVLATNQNGNGETATAGKDNLYALHDEGSRWSSTFVATLSSEDSPEWEGNRVSDTAYLTARVSSNGRYLAFMSSAPLTGYDNIDSSLAAHGASDEEVYLYDSETASLRCVSCNPSGARPAGVLDTTESGEGLGLLVDRRKIWAELGKEHWLAGNIPGWTAQSLTGALVQPRYLSDEGRLYFNSPDSLVPAAKNAKEDVYEYEPSGVGSCESPSGGCVSLISGGSSDHESAFIEATPDGSSVFFVTEGRLLLQDTDTAFDIYAARECTGASPCLTSPPPPPPGCGETDTCRPAQPARQIPGGPSGTATISGAGNLTAHPAPAKQDVQAVKNTSKPLTRAQKLTRALKSCRKRYAHSKKKRTSCERTANKRYGNQHKAKNKTKGKATTRGKSSAGRRAR